MKLLFLFSSFIFLLLRCQPDELPVNSAATLDKPFEIALHETTVLTGTTGEDENKVLGQLTFSHLDESRCPANAMCIRQGAAVTTFQLSTEPSAEPQTIRLFVGDFMANDPRNKRNLTADTATVQLANKARYRLILQQVSPYPGTGQDTPKATLLLEMQ